MPRISFLRFLIILIDLWDGLNFVLTPNFVKTQIKIVGNLKFCVLNTGGLRSKLKSEDFFETINEFDIICLLEIKRIKMILTEVESYIIPMLVFLPFVKGNGN